MNYIQLHWKELDATIKFGIFRPKNGITEYHVVVELNNKYLKTEKQFKNITRAIEQLKQTNELKKSALVFKRYFLSDAVNQAHLINTSEDNVAVSVVQQPPLNGTKVLAWLYYVETGAVQTDESGTIVLKRPHYEHLYNTQLQQPLLDEYAETTYIFEKYIDLLRSRSCTLKGNCIRTWIYVQGVDVHYAEMVKSRMNYFIQEGLTNETHYIASTGIEGKYINPKSLVLMDAYAVKGVQQEQIKYLYAPTHLNPTYEYGVTFERGTAVDYGDRRHIFISGTASIDNKGEIVHPFDIEKQIERTVENITVLLTEADAEMSDIAQMIVYLRDTADYETVVVYLQRHYSDIPKVVVWAPVCRPGWLVEIECIAIKEVDTRFEKF